MDLEKTLQKINKDRDKVEAAFTFCLWSDPMLYEMYMNLNINGDKTLQSKDAAFYYMLGREMYRMGYKTFDHVTIDTFLDGKPAIKAIFDEYGGYREVQELKSIVDVSNVEAYFEKITKMNNLSSIAKGYEKAMENVERFDNMTNEEVFTTFDYINSNSAISAGNNERIETLSVDKAFIEKLNSGESVGFSYNTYAPMLNYITLGAAPSSLYLLGAHSGMGKTSWVFEVMLMGLHKNGVKTAIVSNEMLIESYKLLLIEHVLTKDLGYWGLTRKQVKQGKFNPEQREMLEKAAVVITEKYSDISFVKVFDNDMNKIMKYMRKLKAQGVQVVFYDTFKSDDSADGNNLWQTLMLDARRLFQCCCKLGICCVTTYQLALHTENYRYLTASCLSNSKQIKEVYETMVYMRTLWQDEYSGQKYDVHPYRFKRGDSKIKEEITLDPDKRYVLFFVDKTRADEDKQIVLFEWNPRFNNWKEIGYAKVVNDHRQGVT